MAIKKRKTQPRKEVEWYSVRVPREWLTTYTYHSERNGQDYEKFTLHIPDNMIVGGEDLTGYTCNFFMNDHNHEQWESDETLITLSWRSEDGLRIDGYDDDGDWDPDAGFEIDGDDQYDFRKALVKQRKAWERAHNDATEYADSDHDYDDASYDDSTYADGGYTDSSEYGVGYDDTDDQF